MLQRAVHLGAALLVVFLVYSPGGEQVAAMVRSAALPLLIATGIATWLAPRIRPAAKANTRTIGNHKGECKMTSGFAIAMLVAGGLYAGGALSIGWERSGAWRVASSLDFRRDFAHTIGQADKLQPALLAVTTLSAVGFAFETAGLPRVLAATAAVGLVAVFVASAATLVRIQRRIVSKQPELATAEVERLKETWIGGHLARTAAGVACFALLVAAAVV